ncbi:MAG: hypothetical protein KDD41_09260 [Flavobacteriales bacterium]|nr:hypothetical protein [Flavobacteriales bacterium]
MEKVFKVLFYCIVSISIFSCGGTHGSIKEYDFGISEEELMIEIDNLVNENVDLSFQEHDMGSEYFSLVINEDVDYTFVYRFYGGEKEQKSPGSRIFIAYVKIDNGKFLTTKNISSNDKVKTLTIFEDNFINKLN